MISSVIGALATQSGAWLSLSGALVSLLSWAEWFGALNCALDCVLPRMWRSLVHVLKKTSHQHLLRAKVMVASRRLGRAEWDDESAEIAYDGMVRLDEREYVRKEGEGLCLEVLFVLRCSRWTVLPLGARVRECRTRHHSEREA